VQDVKNRNNEANQDKANGGIAIHVV